MKKKGKYSKDEQDLRERAEALLNGQSIKTEDLSKESIQALLHELQVYQIELNMQNEELREAQERLENTRNEYTDLFDFAPNGYYIFDTYGIILQANLTGCQMLGMERSQLIGKPFSKFITKDSQDTYYFARQKALKSTKSHAYELILKRSDNTTFYAQLESIALTDSAGNFNQLRTSVTDITEVIQARLVLDHQRLLKQLVAAAAEAIILMDDKGRIRMCNSQCEQLFGYTEAELLGQPMEILMPKSFEKAHERYRNHYMESPYLRPMGSGRDFFGINKQGKWIPIEIGLSTFMIEGKRMVSAFINNITERKKAEEELRREKETAQLYLDMANSIFLVIGRDENVIMINRKGCEILGYEENQIKGKNWFHHFVPKSEENQMKSVFEELVKGKLKQKAFIENDIIAKGGKVRTIEWHNAVLTNTKGDTIGTLSSGVDVTEQKRARAALFNAVYVGQEQERERISRELHDSIGQQLAASKMLLGAFEFDIEKLDTDSKIYYQKAVELLEMATAETRAISHNLSPHYLTENGLVPAIKKLCAEVAGHDELKCSIQAIGMKDVRLDHQIELGLFRIMQELYSNVIKHAKASKVKVTVKRLKKRIILTIEDNGAGFRGTLEDIQHKGIGLKNITSRVKGLQGKLKVATSKNKGTTVVIDIPLTNIK